VARLLPIVVLLFAAAAWAGCGDGDERASPPPPATTTGSTETESAPAPPPPPPPAAAGERPGRVLTRFVRAARARTYAAMWELLSQPTQRRLGPSLERFRSGVGRGLARELGAFVPGRSRAFLDEPITSLFAVAAYGGRTRLGGAQPYATYAAALRREGGFWRLELGGPVELRPLGPDPGSVENGAIQVAAEVESAAPIVEGGMWLDGQAVPGRSAGLGATRMTMFGDARAGIPRGPHAVVAFASTFADASALAWTFVYR
jgi:hypothetical protein